MTDEQKNTKKESLNCCVGMDFAEMMRNMMNQQGKELDSNCAEMMQKMMAMYCRSAEEKEETAE